MQTAKDYARELLDNLPDDATLNDIRYQLNDSLYTLYVRQQIEQGMEDSLADRVVSHTDIKKRYLNDER